MLNLPLSWIPRKNETCKYNQTKPEFIFFFCQIRDFQDSSADIILFPSIIAAIETNAAIPMILFFLLVIKVSVLAPCTLPLFLLHLRIFNT